MPASRDKFIKCGSRARATNLKWPSLSPDGLLHGSAVLVLLDPLLYLLSLGTFAIVSLRYRRQSHTRQTQERRNRVNRAQLPAVAELAPGLRSCLPARVGVANNRFLESFHLVNDLPDCSLIWWI